MNFDSLVAALLGPTANVSVIGPKQSRQEKSIFKAFKKKLAKHLISEDDIARNSPVIKQILNATNLEQIEAYLKQVGYCDNGILKTYRMFISQESYDQQDY